MDGPELSWGRTPQDQLEHWPKSADGTPEKAVFLTDAFEADAGADLLVQKLSAYGIPAVRRYARDGTLGKVVLGFSGYGVGLYVPESMLEDAQELLRPVSDEELEAAACSDGENDGDNSEN